jgi:hypothetical protein
MAVTAHFYDSYWLSLNAAKINLLSDTLKLMLATSAYTPNRGTDQYKSAVTNEVANGNGYTTGGTTIGSMAIAAASNVVTITGANASWPSSTFTCRYAILYDSTPSTDATRPLVGYVDFGADQSPSNGTLSVTWNASGIGTVTDS